MNSVILKKDFESLVSQPGFVDIQVFYTGQKLFNAVVYHQLEADKNKTLMGVLIEDERTPFTDNDINRFLIKLHKLIEHNKNVRIHELNMDKNLLRETMH